MVLHWLFYKGFLQVLRFMIVASGYQMFVGVILGIEHFSSIARVSSQLEMIIYFYFPLRSSYIFIIFK